ncbi:hypothetical protein MYSEV_230 [Mythimna separata entomopoxvirus 'L']|uniref:Uncharacterized protein n=1 Tax=Mythimna separata entomopoxvirus 'L' TaxID=1293572 RepID=A0A916KQC2_9POXV|nr:hypothetical protein MYSEV_230 [Mythimna separata entomopoxvirus 'L']CCU56428.1 hypothetical protein MYSEV_230 [Mythimna separata entomopoxvirus 'L']
MKYKSTSLFIFFAKFDSKKWDLYKEKIKKKLEYGRKQYYSKYLIGTIPDFIKDNNYIYKLFELSVPRIFKYYIDDKININIINKSKKLDTYNLNDIYVVIGGIGKHNPGNLDINNIKINSIDYFNFFIDILHDIPDYEYNIVYYKYMINDILDEFININPEEYLSIINASFY